ncbi:unnamed protein product [Vitrella brassicaformis CCMP3155]|uniref:Integrase catalytic domain-containing protein n=1 Tax=Vitrella brassicaformis (strain CCMP3155) TaxID=1169540 RepID=A0A0G4EDJ9_VITBC|nr:unnamed protein product [Vitrella brassicaformis CCMP3155]|eukprot:CEL93437.1 unnamed protein product [Vitrella brassicaformis CCMP3155]
MLWRRTHTVHRRHLRLRLRQGDPGSLKSLPRGQSVRSSSGFGRASKAARSNARSWRASTTCSTTLIWTADPSNPQTFTLAQGQPRTQVQRVTAGGEQTGGSGGLRSHAHTYGAPGGMAGQPDTFVIPIDHQPPPPPTPPPDQQRASWWARMANIGGRAFASSQTPAHASANASAPPQHATTDDSGPFYSPETPATAPVYHPSVRADPETARRARESVTVGATHPGVDMALEDIERALAWHLERQVQVQGELERAYQDRGHEGQRRERLAQLHEMSRQIGQDVETSRHRRMERIQYLSDQALQAGQPGGDAHVGAGGQTDGDPLSGSGAIRRRPAAQHRPAPAPPPPPPSHGLAPLLPQPAPAGGRRAGTAQPLSGSAAASSVLPPVEGRAGGGQGQCAHGEGVDGEASRGQGTGSSHRRSASEHPDPHDGSRRQGRGVEVDNASHGVRGDDMGGSSVTYRGADFSTHRSPQRSTDGHPRPRSTSRRRHKTAEERKEEKMDSELKLPALLEYDNKVGGKWHRWKTQVEIFFTYYLEQEKVLTQGPCGSDSPAVQKARTQLFGHLHNRLDMTIWAAVKSMIGTEALLAKNGTAAWQALQQWMEPRTESYLEELHKKLNTLPRAATAELAAIQIRGLEAEILEAGGQLDLDPTRLHRYICTMPDNMLPAIQHIKTVRHQLKDVFEQQRQQLMACGIAVPDNHPVVPDLTLESLAQQVEKLEKEPNTSLDHLHIPGLTSKASSTPSGAYLANSNNNRSGGGQSDQHKGSSGGGGNKGGQKGKSRPSGSAPEGKMFAPVKQKGDGGGQQTQQGTGASASGGGKKENPPGHGNHENLKKPTPAEAGCYTYRDYLRKKGKDIPKTWAAKQCGGGKSSGGGGGGHAVRLAIMDEPAPPAASDDTPTPPHPPGPTPSTTPDESAYYTRTELTAGTDFSVKGKLGFDFEKDHLQLPDLDEDDKVILLLQDGSQYVVMDGGASTHIFKDKRFLIPGSERPTPGLTIKTAHEGHDLKILCRGEAIIIVIDKNGQHLPMKLAPMYVAPDCPATLISERQLHTRGGGVHKVAGEADQAYLYWHVIGIDGIRQTRVVPLDCVTGGYRLMVRPWTEDDDKRAEEMAAYVTVGDSMETSWDVLLAGGGRTHDDDVSSSDSSDGESDGDGADGLDRDVCEADGCEADAGRQLSEVIMTNKERENLRNAFELHKCAGHKGFDALLKLSRTLRGAKPVDKTEAADIFRHFHRETSIIQEINGPIRGISVDPGSELCEPNAPFGKAIKELGIEGPIVTPARRHEHHGKAERAIGVLGEIGRTVPVASGLDATHCGQYAWQYAVQTYNMTALVKHNGQTHTSEGWCFEGRDPHVHHLHPFGCSATVLIPKERQGHRLATFVGSSESGGGETSTRLGGAAGADGDTTQQQQQRQVQQPPSQPVQLKVAERPQRDRRPPARPSDEGYQWHRPAAPPRQSTPRSQQDGHPAAGVQMEEETVSGGVQPDGESRAAVDNAGVEAGESPAAEPVPQQGRLGGEGAEIVVRVGVEELSNTASKPLAQPSPIQPSDQTAVSPTPPPPAAPSQTGDAPHNRSDVYCAEGNEQPAEYRGKAFNKWMLPCHPMWPCTYKNLTAYQRPRVKELRRYLAAAGKPA